LTHIKVPPRKARPEGAEQEALKAVKKTKALVRAFVEHPFHRVKKERTHLAEAVETTKQSGATPLSMHK
jgi:hypothetical protein